MNVVLIICHLLGLYIVEWFVIDV